MIDEVLPTASESKKPSKPDPRIRLNKVAKSAKQAGSEVQAYLSGRGLNMANLYQSKMRHDNGKIYDCMLGKIVDVNNKPQSWHVTYLDSGQKAKVDPVKKILPPVDTITGGAIRLMKPKDVLGIAEGIETAIAASMIFNEPVWAVISAHGMKTFELPKGIQSLAVFGDNDSNYTGQSAAYHVAERYAKKGINVSVQIPTDEGDWCDFLINKQRRKAV